MLAANSFNSSGYKRQQGLTLIELMVTLLVFTLLVSVGAPSLSTMLERTDASADFDKVITSISAARTLAISTSIPHTLCPLDNSLQCQRSWNEQLTLFADYNRNQILDGNDWAVQIVPAADASVLRDYPRNAISFRSTGAAGGYNGSFSYCRKGLQNDTYGNVAIISLQGRIRRGADSNNNGLPETADGKDIPCN
ncbi:GspH/FimT family pseudopilin [Oceanobacter mangrovi]|uniref:GspH/FimT family pseudopilin n=1 Tax=Oceanobacter mangrovi TaxID=2862510 RepID=UPI001C8E7E21|nr:GspH/FimT family pseudopilin [Oceanobacter mangrovi]